MLNNPWYYRIGRELVKERKPCQVGDRIHMHGWHGMYKVHEVRLDYFVVYKQGKKCKVPWHQYRCKEGESNDPIKLLKREIKSIVSGLELELEHLKNVSINLDQWKGGQTRLR